MFITKEKSTTDIQKEFQEAFPGLSIIFYQKAHGFSEGSKKNLEIVLPSKIRVLNPNCKEGEFMLDENMSTGQLEASFEREFGLHIQVFRRSNEKWLQTITTDNWSLKDQNSKGLHSIINK